MHAWRVMGVIFNFYVLPLLYVTEVLAAFILGEKRYWSVKTLMKQKKMEFSPLLMYVIRSTKFSRNSGVPRNFVRGRWGSTNSVEDRWQSKRGSGGGSPLVRGSGGSCNVTRNFISYIKMFLIFGTLRLFMMTTNLFVITNVKQLRT